MPTKNTPTAKRLIWLSTNLILLCIASLWPSSAAGASVTASKSCLTTCTVVEASFSITTTQTIQWQATYTGSATQGHSFFLSTVASNLADIPLTTNGQGSGTRVLTPGTYHISIRLALMGPGFYTVTYNAGTSGDPHLTTSDGNHFDFQAAGEFVFLRHSNGLEIQVRQGPIATASNPGPDPRTGLATCVSINTAVAARVGTRRVTYEPNLSGVPDPSGLQLRVDGVLTTLDSRRGLKLENGGRISKTTVPGGLRIDFPDKTVLFVIPAWWPEQKVWYLNLDVGPPPGSTGLAGPLATRSWLPALPDGTSLGPMPDAPDERFVDLYQKFGNAWRVTAATSLFDYGPGTSTDTFTINWPPERPPCSLPNSIPATATTEAVAQQACQLVKGETHKQNCVFDVMITGNTGFATSYLLLQDVQPQPASTQPQSKFAVSADFGAGIPHGTFSNFFDPGFSFNAALEYVISPYVSAEGKFGYHRFPGDNGGNLNLYQFSGNGKFYLVPEPNKIRPFLNGGVGAYKFDSGPTKFGGNLGAGMLFEVTPHFGLQASYNFHAVNTSGVTTRFSTVQGGVRWRF
ncbi:MAG: porin family protein [Pyrinomonadaceae bacterium]